MKRPEGFDTEGFDPERQAPKNPPPTSRGAVRVRDAGRVRGGRNVRQAPPTSSAVPVVRQVPREPAKAPQAKIRRERVPADRKAESGVRAAARERKRFERREVRRFTRRTRNRRLGWLSAAIITAVMAIVLAVAVYSPILSLRTITVDGATKVNALEVRNAIDGQLGTPLALLDYGKLRSELDAFPLIRSFATEIVPPSTLVVHIVERSPVGVVVTSTGFAIVDPAGVVLETSATRPDGIPLINLGGNGTDSVAFSAVVDVMLALPASIRSRVDVAQASSKDDVRLVLSGSGARIVWGSAERSALKARVLTELMAAQGKNSRVEYDVSAPLSPVVRPG